MLQEQFINTLKNPSLLNDASVVELELIVNEFPFFETAHLLYTKGLQKQNSLLYSKQLRKTAIIANSRVLLHELLHKKEISGVIEKEVLVIEEEIESEIIVENSLPIEEKIIISNITTTDSEIKVIYVNTIPSDKIIKTEEVNSEQKISESKPEEIEILQEIENETEPKQFDIDKLNKTIEQEISRGIIQSFVESDILKTPELNKIEKTEPVSFTDWLHKIQKESHTIQKIEQNSEEKTSKVIPNEVKSEEKAPFFNQNRQLIDKIIESDPGRLKLGTNKFFTPNLDAKQSLLENEHLVTETLAKIYALQGNTNKAIRAYEILSLKFPQKSVYFTTLIQNLKNNK
jgi:hypothetical protein